MTMRRSEVLLRLGAIMFAWASLAVHARQLDLTVRLDPATRVVEGRAVIRIEPRAAVTLELDARHVVQAAALDGRPVVGGTDDGRHAWRVSAADRGATLEITWRGALDALPTEVSDRDALRTDRAFADTRGSFLPAFAAWHPVAREGFTGYRVTLDLPADHPGLVPGDLLEESTRDGRYRATFAFRHRNGGVDLMAGPYQVGTRAHRTPGGRHVVLRTCLPPDLVHLADAYLESSARFIDRYDRAIGPYPYNVFSVVSSPTPTGFGMPALTYLGAQVLRLPFIRDTSFGHEVLHNWWGNGVFVDYARGNWSEGLTTFMADYAYRVDAGPAEARAMRLDWLRDLASVPPSQDQPLRAFVARHHMASQIIGYRKTAMLFSMLSDEIGTDAFSGAMRAFWGRHRFRVASWDDLWAEIARVAKRDLSRDRAQWLDRTGLPELRLHGVQRDPRGIEITITQSGTPFAVRVPVVVETDGRRREHRVDMEERTTRVALPVDAGAGRVLLDPDFRTLRALAESELPPILRQVMASARPRLLVPTDDAEVRAAALRLGAVMLDQSATMTERGDAAGDVLVVGLAPDVARWLADQGLAMPAEVDRPADAQVWAVRRAGGVAVVVAARDAATIDALARPLPHYGRQSWLVMAGGRVTDRGVWPAAPQSLAFE